MHSYKKQNGVIFEIVKSKAFLTSTWKEGIYMYVDFLQASKVSAGL